MLWLVVVTIILSKYLNPQDIHMNSISKRTTFKKVHSIMSALGYNWPWTSGDNWPGSTVPGAVNLKTFLVLKKPFMIFN